MTLYTDTFSTPFGPFSIAVDEAGALFATAFGSGENLHQRLEVCRVGYGTSADPSPRLAEDSSATRVAREQVLAYCAGERQEFSVPLAAHGTEFQRRVWAALRGIPFGETRTYGQLAATLDNPAASRAVGRANAMNPICLIVPCHRVIGANGALTGFAFGEDIKRRLLDHERAVITRPRAA